jgi:hypothetical protein
VDDEGTEEPDLSSIIHVRHLCNSAAMTWAAIHEKILSTLSTPVPLEFRVAAGNSNRATGAHQPANFDLHIPTDRQLRFVKWAPRLVEYGMGKLKAFCAMDAPARDPGHIFWRTASSIRAVGKLTSTPVVTGETQIQSSTDHHILSPICSIASRIIFHLNSDCPSRREMNTIISMPKLATMVLLCGTLL